MQERYYEMIDLYIKSKQMRFYYELEFYNREILEDFFYYQVDQKGDDWNIEDISEDDIREYHHYLAEKSPHKMLLYSKGKIQVIEGFLEFAFQMGWIHKNPWEDGGEND